MKKYSMNEEEKTYLSKYNINNYERPSIAADIAVFSILNEGSNVNIRKLQQKALKILLVKRGTYPYKNCYALPGGFCGLNENVIDAAKRELAEETNVKDAYLQLVDVFGKKNRDPRGWIISNTFMALINGELCNLRAGTDAWEAKWFNISISAREEKRENTNNSILIKTDYELKLSNDESGTNILSHIIENKKFCNYHETVDYEIIADDNLAFDHAEIILRSYLLLKRNVTNDLKMAFDLMPELFTLTELQNAFEIILDKQLVTANFRRKISEYVIESEEKLDGKGFRPAKLFKRNLDKFYS